MSRRLIRARMLAAQHASLNVGQTIDGHETPETAERDERGRAWRTERRRRYRLPADAPTSLRPADDPKPAA